MKRRTVQAICASLVAVVSSLGAQQRPISTIMLDMRGIEFPEPFSQIQGLVELRDGRLLLVDAQEKEIRLVDVAHGTMTRVSRLGGGPLEYQMPGILLYGAADTVTYYDVAQRRFLLLSQRGEPVRTQSLGASDPMAALTQVIPSMVDAAGRVYGVTLGMTVPTGTSTGASPAGPMFADSISVQQFDPASGQAKSLARLRSPMSQSKPSMEMGAAGMKMTMTAPDYRPSDVWTVLPDGRLAVLRDGVYRVHFIANGRPEVLGPLVPSTPVPLTTAEQRAVMDSIRVAVAAQLKKTRELFAEAAGAGGATMPSIDFQVLEPPKWAATKPLYISIQSSLDGHLWVAKSLPAGTKYAQYDILDGTGALVAKVQLAPGERLAGIGRTTVYTIRTDQDDLQYLRRYSLPTIR